MGSRIMVNPVKDTKVKNLQKMGGIAALGHTTALVIGMALSFTVMFPLLDADPDQAQEIFGREPASRVPVESDR